MAGGRRGQRPPGRACSARIAAAIVATVRRCGTNALLRRIVDVDPEVLLPYLLDRRGRSQEMVADALGRADRAGADAQGRSAGRPGRARAQPRARLPRVHPLGAHHVRRPRARRGREPPRRRARPARAEVPRADDATHRTARSTSASPTSPSRTDVLVIGLGHHRRRRRPRRRQPRASRGRRRRARRRLRHQPVELQAGARRAALPRQRPGRRGPRERRRARHPDADHRTAPDPRAADADAADPRGQPRRRAALARAGPAGRRPAPARRAHRRETLPRPRRIGVTETLTLAPVVRRDGLRGGLLSWDGQLEDDARLVLAVARTAVAQGARVHTRVRVSEPTGHQRRAHRRAAPARAAPIRATDGHQRRPASGPATWSRRSRCGPAAAPTWCCARTPCPGVRCAIMAPVPGAQQPLRVRPPAARRDLLRRASPTRRSTEIPDVPEPPEEDIEFLLGVINTAFERRLTPRPGGRRLRRTASAARRRRRRRPTSRASTRCSSRGTGVVTVVGGKLTTYRRMAQDAVDRGRHGARADGRARAARPHCRCSAPADRRARQRSTPRNDWCAASASRRPPCSPTRVAVDRARRRGAARADRTAACTLTLAELVFGVTHEGAATVEDLLDRRTRIGLVPADAELARPAAERALELAKVVTS